MAEDMKPDRLMTLDEVAGYLGVTSNAMYTMRHRGRGPQAFRLGTRLRYRRSEVDAWLEAHRDEPREVPRQPVGVP